MAGDTFVPRMISISSVLPARRLIRRPVLPHGQSPAWRLVRSRVRYRTIGNASFVSVVMTSSPVWPGGTG